MAGLTAFAMRRWLPAMAAGLASVILVAAGCGVDDDEAAPGTSTTLDEDTGQTDGDQDDPEQDGSEPTPSTAVEVGSDLPEDAPLDLQVAHPNGTTLIVRGVTFHEDRIQVTFSATNANDDDIELADFGMVLRDDLGTTYRLSPPAANPDIAVARQSSIEGTLVFLGRVAPGASRLALTTNARTSGNASEFSRDPNIVIDGIPVNRSTGGDEDGTTAPPTTAAPPTAVPPTAVAPVPGG